MALVIIVKFRQFQIFHDHKKLSKIIGVIALYIYSIVLWLYIVRCLRRIVRIDEIIEIY
jgi:hypothetical protein